MLERDAHFQSCPGSVCWNGLHFWREPWWPGTDQISSHQIYQISNQVHQISSDLNVDDIPPPHITLVKWGGGFPWNNVSPVAGLLFLHFKVCSRLDLDTADSCGNDDVSMSYCHLGEPTSARSAFFLNIVQKAFAPPPLVLNIMLQIFLMDFLKSA